MADTRWAFMRVKRIVGTDGAPYLTRLRVVATPWFGVYLHRIHREDWDRALHSHPWSFSSVVLRGGYREQLRERGCTPLIPGAGYAPVATHWRRPLRPRIFPRDAVHRIDEVLPNTWTLVLVGRRRDDWGFYVPGRGLVPWATYLREQGHPQGME